MDVMVDRGTCQPCPPAPLLEVRPPVPSPAHPKNSVPRAQSRHRVFIDNIGQEVWWPLPLSQQGGALGGAGTSITLDFGH